MKTIKETDRTLSVVFLCAAIAALLLRDPTFALACCAMAGVFRLDSEKER